VAELGAFSPQLAERPTLVALNKVDLPEAGEAAGELEPEFAGSHRISAAAGIGTRDLLDAAAALVASARQAAAGPPGEAGGAQRAGEVGAAAGGHRVYRHVSQAPGPPRVERDPDGAYRVIDPAVLRMVERTDLDEEEAVAVLHRRLAAAGVDTALGAAGCQDGNTVRIGSAEFTFAADAMSSMPRPPRRSRR